MFGYPTGLGALVVRHEALAELRRPWFSGGTVDFVSVRHEIHALRDGVEGFEDGTANFLGIGAVPFGLGFLEEVGLENIERHATTLSQRLIDALLALRHPSGKPMTTVYGARDNGDRGATVAFNVIDRDGVVVPYSVIEARARGARVSVRGGCFCNPGASEAAFGFPAELTPRCLAATRAHGWSIPRFAECMRGYAVGAVRASFGIPSVQADVDRLIRVIEEVGGTR
jgi:selenocysteine lyase/cysteine desulfurase